MAGLGYKDFTAGAVLTAAQVDGYLMEQAVMNFAGTAARGSALSGVVAAGMVAHVGAGTLTVYDGSAWQQVYPNTPGLVYVAGTAFSAVSSVSVNNCFTSTYANYRVTIELSAMSATSGAALRARLRVSGSDNSSSNYYFNGPDVATSSTQTVGVTRSAGLGTWWTWGSDNANPGFSSIDVFNPQLSVKTAFAGSFSAASTTDFRFNALGGLMSVTTAYDGFTLLPDSGTITGTVRVYGYRNS